MAVLNVKHGVGAIISVAAGILTGTLIGFLQGFWFTRFKIPSFVVTLAGLLAWEGALILILGTTGTINVFDPGIDAIAGNFLSTTQGWVLAIVGLVVFIGGMLLTRRRRAAAGLELGRVTGVIIRAAIAVALVDVALLVAGAR